MFRATILAFLLTATSASADGCVDYAKQKVAAAELGMAALVVQVNLLILSSTRSMSPEVSAEVKKAADDLKKAVTKSADALTSIRDNTTCP
ncbi:hypothetical protein [Acidiphilium sp.]|uniref:hypothetical protein n=1 Tax=Acidiphilium sp. TaxID=527 RepID=UPI0025888029|nr:hypothetical protein [Acidiphilium sp.]